MINLNELAKSDIGKWVEYDSGYSKERGRIKSWNEMYIFVVYHPDNNWNNFQDYTAVATTPEYLDFIKPEWTHNICRSCWVKIKGTIPASSVINALEEKCCFCGKLNEDGIFIREDQNKTICKGEH